MCSSDLCDAAVGRVINIGSGREVSVGDLAQMIVSLIGSRSEVIEDRQRLRPAASEVDRLLCDNTVAREVLGWTPRVSLEEGLRQTIEWIARHRDRFKADLYNI